LAKERRDAETPEARRKRLAVQYEGRRRRIAADPAFHIRLTVSSRIAQTLAIRGTSKRSRSWEQVVGYSLAELRSHLERQFTGRMSWDNYGKWHVDHIVPIAAFDIKSPDDDAFKACWALANLRPLWAVANQRKHAKRLHLI